MLRRVIAGLVVVGLAVGVWLIWPRSGDAGPRSTTAVAVGSTNSSTTATVTPSAPPPITPESSSTTTGVSHVVDTVEEAEEILRELWFGWFEGIYNQDEDRIREVVATEETVETAKESFGIEFASAPTPESISFNQTEILRSDEDCLAVWTVMTLSDFREGTTEGVNVIRRHSDDWVRLTVWAHAGDLWETDCESLLS